MKILLLGEYSNVHWTLAEALRKLGHSVTVAGNGDFWKQYPCDIRLERRPGGKLEALRYFARTSAAFSNFRGFDVVQLINPMFLELKAENITPFYHMLRRRNGKVFLDAFGMDHYYVKACIEKRFEYSELVVDGEFRNIEDNRNSVRDWIDGAKAPLNRMIAEDCDGIIAGLWEYFKSYESDFPEKTVYIPFPVPEAEPAERFLTQPDGIIRFFIGIQRNRSKFKGTDILLPVLRDIERTHSDRCSVVSVENVPFNEYKQMMRSSDILVDQLYSPTPNMNSLLAMSQGLAVAGGGEEEPYRFIGEDKLRPIINLPCHYDEIVEALSSIVDEGPNELYRRKKESIAYVRKHHDTQAIAKRYLEFWENS